MTVGKRKMSSRILAVLSLLVLLFCAVICWQETLYGVTVEFGETSGTIRVSNENNSIAISFKEIVEKAENGRDVGSKSSLKHYFRNFDYQAFYSNGPPIYVEEFSDESLTNISVFKKNFTAFLDGPGATFNIEVWVYGNDTIIRNNNSPETYQVFNGTVKFAFSIDNWLFCGYNDTECVNHDGTMLEYGKYLDISMNYYADRKDEPPVTGKVRGRSDVERRPRTYNYGGAEVTSSQMYMLNETWEYLPRGYPKLIRKMDHNYVMKNYEVIRLPAFYEPIYYYAFVNMSSMEYYMGAGTQLQCTSTSIFITVLVLLFHFWYV